MLLTRSPLSPKNASAPWIPFDLHVLSTPPAFILSQDQTLQQKPKTKPTKKQQAKKRSNQKSQTKMVQARKQSSKNKHQQSKNKTFQNHQHQKKQKTEKTKTPNQTARHPSQSHTNKTKKHTIENTNNQTTNQPNWPVRIRREQKIIGGKLAFRRLRRSATNTKLPPLRPRVKPD